MTKVKCPLEGVVINYKDTELLKKYITKFGKIVPRYYSNVCLKNQRKLANAIKMARIMALLPFVNTYDPEFNSAK